MGANLVMANACLIYLFSKKCARG